MFLLGLSMLLFLYIPQFLARYREYVGEIYELEYYLIFFFFLPFPFLFLSFFILFLFALYSIPTTTDGAYLSFYQNIFI
jgi:hypothetical protein